MRKRQARIVDATIIAAPSSTKNIKSAERDPRCTRRRKANNGVCHEHERKLVMLY